jgi:carboxyl-terminal processing protease
MNNSNRSSFLPIIISISICIGFCISFLTWNPFAINSKSKELQKLEDVLTLLNEKYVDSVNTGKIFDETIVEMLHKLDPHSNYIPAEEMKTLAESIDGNFGGIGVRFFKLRDTICVSNVIAGSPSEKTGLKAGDQIVEIENNNAAGIGISNDEIMKKLKGERGSSVNITVNRYGKLIPFKIERGTIPILSVVAAHMIDDKTGYVKINQFSVPTAREFRLASAALKSQGMKRLILDLRHNGGGVLQGAVEITDEFLKEGLNIVSTAGENAPSKSYSSTAGGILEETPLAVLINSASASASEIVAGAIQDNDRGFIFGRRSFGKGLVQEDQMLRDGSTVRITIARYYTPSGRCIQRPYSGDYDAYYEDLNRGEGSMFKVDSSVFIDSLKYQTIGGRTVYGGGGISPDVFVPYDTTGSTFYATSLEWSGVFNQFVFDWCKKSKQFIETSWQSFNEYDQKFASLDLLPKLVEYAEREFKINPMNISELNSSSERILRRLKSEIARQFYNEDGFYKVYNRDDADVKTALQSFGE